METPAAETVLPVAALVSAAFVVSAAGTAVYRHVAADRGILAHPKERGLHHVAVPRGAGVVISAVFFAGVVAWVNLGHFPPRLFVACLGAVPLALVGAVDDVRHVPAPLRLAIHIAVAVWALAWLGGMPDLVIGPWQLRTGIVWDVVVLLGIVWMINLFNFMDGADGVAASGSVVFAGVAATLTIGAGSPDLAVALLLLAAACAGFLIFNWPPARIFMGDSGSAVLGFLFAVLALATAGDGSLGIWTWIALMAYFLADTTTTMVLRIATVKRWWTPHRSHAYQNLAYIWADHRRVALLVLGYSVFWAVPLAVATVAWPLIAPILALLAVTPGVILAILRGPLYRS